jgi:tetratricopeptide (TPR) repeat protein
MRRFEESLAQSRKVEELEPISANRKATTAGTLYCAGRYEEAIETLFQALELEADNWTAHYYLGRIYVQLAKYREAISEYQKAKSLLRRSVELEALLAHAYAVSGQTKTAEKILAKLDERSNREYVPPCHKAWIHMGLDQKDLAFACLEKAYQEHDLNLVILATDPIFQGLHDEVRFEQLLQRIGLMAHLGESRKQTKAKAE